MRVAFLTVFDPPLDTAIALAAVSPLSITLPTRVRLTYTSSTDAARTASTLAPSFSRAGISLSWDSASIIIRSGVSAATRLPWSDCRPCPPPAVSQLRPGYLDELSRPMAVPPAWYSVSVAVGSRVTMRAGFCAIFTERPSRSVTVTG